MICNESSGYDVVESERMQNIENRIDTGRSFYSTECDDQLIKFTTRVNGGGSLADHIKNNLHNIRIDLDLATSNQMAALNYAKMNKIQMLALTSQLVENQG